jgi:group I intron endonuclease
MRVYLLENVFNGKCYVGQTRRTLAYRFRQHLYQARTDGRLRSPLKSALLKYGPDAFRLSELGEYSTQAETDQAEADFIDHLNTRYPQGYNLRAGGLSGVHSAETIAKLRGQKRSEETKAKLRAVPRTPEWCANLSAAHRGKTASNTQRAALDRHRLRGPQQPQRGEANHNAVLTEAQVAEIRRLYQTGQWSQQVLADRFGVSQSTVSQITRKQIWNAKGEMMSENLNPVVIAPGEVSELEVKEALRKLLDHQNAPALNYAVNYAKAALSMQGYELYVQVLYVQNNLDDWSGKTAKAVKNVLRRFVKQWDEQTHLKGAKRR